MSQGPVLDQPVVRALLERERQALVGRLMAGLVHNFSGALQMVRLPVDLLQLRLSSGDVKGAAKSLGTLIEGIDRLDQEVALLADKVRQAEEPPTGKLNLVQLAEDQLSFWVADNYFKHELELIRRWPQDLPRALGGYQQAALAFNAVVANAIEALRGRSDGRLVVEGKAEGGRVSLLISDNGPGPDPGLGETIFEPFVSSKGPEHHGLGLYLGRFALAECGGSLSWRADTPGRFEITLPLAPR